MFRVPVQFRKIDNVSITRGLTGYYVDETESYKILGVVRKDPDDPKRWLYEGIDSPDDFGKGFKTRQKAAETLWWELIGNKRMAALQEQQLRQGRMRALLPQNRTWGDRKNQGNKMSVEMANRIYDVLVECVEASDREGSWIRAAFVDSHTIHEYISSEHRLTTRTLGHGGKFRNEGSCWHVDCYSEHEDFISLPGIVKANKALMALWMEHMKQNTLLYAIEKGMYDVEVIQGKTPGSVKLSQQGFVAVR